MVNIIYISFRRCRNQIYLVLFLFFPISFPLFLFFPESVLVLVNE